MGKQVVKTETVKWIWIGQEQLRRYPIKRLKKRTENSLEGRDGKTFCTFFTMCCSGEDKKMWHRKIYFHHLFPAAGKSKNYIAQWKQKSAKSETQVQLFKVLGTLHKESYCRRFGTWMFWSTKGKSQRMVYRTPMVWIYFQIKVSICLFHHTSCAFIEKIARTWS